MITSASSGAGLLIALLLLPLAGGIGVAFLRNGRVAKQAAVGVSVVELALAAVVWFTYHAGGARLQLASSVDWIAPLGAHISFGVDGIALVMIVMIAVLTPVLIAASRQDELPAERGLGGYFSLLLVTEATVIAAFAATDVFLFYVLFELMLLPMYFLIGRYGGARRQYAAMKFFLYSFFGGLIMLGSVIGLFVIGSQRLGAPTYDWATLVGALQGVPASTQIWLWMGFFVAFAIKAPLVPLHTWLPDAVTQSPIAVGVMLVAVLDKVGIYGFLRYNIELFPAASRKLAPLVLVLAVIGVLYGALLAAGQRDMKRFIAYVSVAHFGFMAVGVFAFTQTSMVGAASYMVNHSISTGMFLVVIGMIIVRGRTADAEQYGGLAKAAPLLAGTMFVAGLSTLSLPGTNSFVSEFLVLIGAYPTRPVYSILATVGIIFAALYVLWLYQRVAHGPVRGRLVGVAAEPTDAPGAMRDPQQRIARAGVTDLSRWEKAVLAPLIFLVLALGFYPKPLLNAVGPSVSSTLTVLGVHSSPVPTSVNGK
jgi:NADH-quinone oxidoreductase subunit M